MNGLVSYWKTDINKIKKKLFLLQQLAMKITLPDAIKECILNDTNKIHALLKKGKDHVDRTNIHTNDRRRGDTVSSGRDKDTHTK